MKSSVLLDCAVIEGVNEWTGGGLDLLSQEGSVIETQSRSREGRFQSHMLKGVVSEPPSRHREMHAMPLPS